MVRFATLSELEDITQRVNGPQLRNLASSTRVGKTVFLAHSSKDSLYLPGVIAVLENHGGKVYVDKADSRLPQSTNRKTAEILRSTIRSCRRFVIFVTVNSKDSRWVPWELGLADGEKGAEPVALFPAATRATEQIWAEQEYLGLYQRIVWGKIKGRIEDCWMVLDHVSNTATPLSRWLQGG